MPAATSRRNISIGYESSDTRGRRKLRKIDVRVNRPDVTVRARNGYYPDAPAKAGKRGALPSPLFTALSGVLPKTHIAMQVSAAPFTFAGKREALLAIVVGLRQPAPRGETHVVEHVDLLVQA